MKKEDQKNQKKLSTQEYFTELAVLSKIQWIISLLPVVFPKLGFYVKMFGLCLSTMLKPEVSPSDLDKSPLFVVWDWPYDPSH